ncbi:MAG: hypothetical protein CM15mP127_14940 [Gammaproteobacteria bacterium]|nr:MAG: hypothetical protein CM15mP127_14940 [Gammaproteobacteria bacterium]
MLYALSRNNFTSQHNLDWNLKHLPWNDIFKSFCDFPPFFVHQICALLRKVNQQLNYLPRHLLSPNLTVGTSKNKIHRSVSLTFRFSISKKSITISDNRHFKIIETCPPRYCKSFCTPRFAIANSITSPTYLSGQSIVDLIIGSLISSISFVVGSSDGEEIKILSPLVLIIS